MTLPPPIRPDQVLAQAWPLATPLPEGFAGVVAVIGNFDGVHRGHRALMDHGGSLARGLAAPLVALTFEPHPRSFFRPDAPVFRLTPLPAKARLLAAAGATGVLALAFDAAFAALSAEAFIDEVLLDAMKVCGVVVGHDFHFGQGRRGDPALLAERLAERGVATTIVPPVASGHEVVASRAIRAALEEGDIARANHLLGHGWFVTATVEHGDKRGRELGFPTANLHLPPDCRLRHGIYAVRVGIDGQNRPAVASFGRRPTFDDGRPKLEVFIFDYSGDLYGREIDVSFHGFIRGEAKFASVDELVARMNADCSQARAILSALQVAELR